jgi:hypothetical protein
LLDLEGLEEADLERFRVRYEELARTAREALRRGGIRYRHPGSQAGLDFRSRRFVKRPFPNQIRPFGRVIRRMRRYFHPCPSISRKKWSETTAFFAPKFLAHNVLLQS